MPGIYVQHVVRAHADPGTEPNAKKIYNVYCFKRTTTAGTPTKAQNQTAFKLNVLVPLQACLSINYITDFLDTRFIDDPTDPYLTTALSLNGTTANDSLPSVNNVIVKLTASSRGLSNKGAKKYGPIAEDDTVKDQLKPAALTKWATAMDALLAGYTDAGGFVWQPFILSQTKSTIRGNTADIQGILMSGYAVRPTLFTMKKRKQPLS